MMVVFDDRGQTILFRY